MIYIQGVTGLQAISTQLTKEKIIAALGYTPADQNTFYEDETGALVIADEKGYVIARIDNDGLTTTKVSATAIQLNDEDLATKLETLSNVDLSNYYTKNEVNNVIANIEHPTVDLSPYALTTDVEANKTITDIHMADTMIHVTSDEKKAWTSKSNFSGDYIDLKNAPNINPEDEDNRVIICDASGNIIMQVDAEGLNVTAVYVNGVAMTALPDYSTVVEGSILKIVNGIPTWSET